MKDIIVIAILFFICWELRDINAKVGVEGFAIRDYLSEIQRNTIR